MSGFKGQMIYGTETTVGTQAGTIDQAIPLRDEKIVIDQQRLRDPAMRAGRRTHDPLDTHLGRLDIAGPVKHSLYNKGMESLWPVLFGTVIKTGAGPFVRTGTPGDLTGDGLTAQLGRPGTGGTVHPYTLLGCKFPTWEIRFAENEIAEFGGDLRAMDFTTGTALQAATYPASMTAYSFVQASILVDAAPVKVKSGTMKCEMGLDVERRSAGSSKIEEPLEADLRDFTFELDPEFRDQTHFNRFIAGTKHTLVMQFAAGADSIVLTANCDYDMAGSNIAGPGLLREPLKLTCMGATDAAAFTAVMTNTVP